MNKKKEENQEKKRIAVIRVRGRVHVRKSISDTLKLLNLHRVNHCVVIDSRKEYMRMLQKVKDYVTWGEINLDVFEKLLEKRGKLIGNKKIDNNYLKKNSKYKTIKEFSKAFMDFKSELKDISDIKVVFRLRPPKKGYERKGIKKPYSLGGVLGHRGDRINELLEKMI
ncbi:MAG TPA: 50S ribosomal protein L30 [Candidatus Altiarchaeales archaeon]|nr:50S ribosomal protein L30 [Candidatus Altiarchaeales archaeon]